MNLNPVIARRRLFSTAHIYKQDAFSEDKNREIFGACYSEHGHGHNYTLEIFVEGPIDSINGLVVNVNELDLILKKVCDPFDHKHINFDVPAFQNVVPTTENLASYFFTVTAHELKLALPALALNRIRLFETDDLWAIARETERSSLSESAGEFEVTREIVIRSIHHLETASWSPKQNKDFYGICYGTHGHDYRVQVTCAAPMNVTTGISVNRDELDRVLETEIRAKFDGIDLNKRFDNTSCEQLAQEFYLLLKPHFQKCSLKKVGIQETRKNYFEFPADGFAVGAAAAAAD